MERLDFSKILSGSRTSLGLGKNELCRKAGFNFNQLQRLETAYNTFNMELAFRYMDALGYCIYIQSKGPGRATKIESYDDLFKWLQSKRKETDWTVAALAEMTGFSATSISNVDNGRQAITIDLFLGMANVFNCNIQIKSK